MADATITGIHHISITARDVEASAAWYEQVFGMNRLPSPSRTTTARRPATPS